MYYLFGNSSSFLWGYPVWNMKNVTFGPATISAINQSGLIHPSQQALNIMENQSWPIYVTGPVSDSFPNVSAVFLFPRSPAADGNRRHAVGQSSMVERELRLRRIHTYTNSAPGTGPYMVTGIVVNSYVSFTQNPTYWERQPCGSDCR